MQIYRHFVRISLRRSLGRKRYFDKVESRVFCRCELCCLSYGRMLYCKMGGEPIRFRRIPGFEGNFKRNSPYREFVKQIKKV